MTNNGARNRQSAGQPTGGQFATEAKSADTGVELGGGHDLTTPPSDGYQFHDDYVAAENQARALAAAGHWTAMEHVHTYREDEVWEGLKNDETSADSYEVRVFDTEAELLDFVERGGYTQAPPMGLDDRDMLETEAETDLAEPVVTERRLMVPRTAPALDGEREDAERGYIEAAAGLAVNEETMESEVYDSDGLDPGTRTQLVEDLHDFIDTNNPLLTRLRAEHPDYSAAQLGQDFYLSRNGHGAGFFDSGLGDIGDELQGKARVYGEQGLSTDGEIM